MLVIKAATCEKEGMEIPYCSVCKKILGEQKEIPAIGPQLYSMDYKNKQQQYSNRKFRHVSAIPVRKQRPEIMEEINTICENFRNFASLKDKTENDSAESFRPEKRGSPVIAEGYRVLLYLMRFFNAARQEQTEVVTRAGLVFSYRKWYEKTFLCHRKLHCNLPMASTGFFLFWLNIFSQL